MLDCVDFTCTRSSVVILVVGKLRFPATYMMKSSSGYVPIPTDTMLRIHTPTWISILKINGRILELLPSMIQWQTRGVTDEGIRSLIRTSNCWTLCQLWSNVGPIWRTPSIHFGYIWHSHWMECWFCRCLEWDCSDSRHTLDNPLNVFGATFS